MTGQQQYLESDVLTASPFRLHQLVVDGAIRFARQAEQALEKKDFETSHFALNQSRDLVGELIGGLNDEQAPELVEQLKALFVFVYRNLAHADLLHDVESIRSAIRILTIHRETWSALQQQLRQETAVPRPHISDDAPTTGRSWTT